jgi:hypothetical protein
VWFVENLKRQIESDFLARLNLVAEVRFVNPRSQAVPDEAGGPTLSPPETGRPLIQS